jgi:spermidine dehydrogenase
LQYRSPHSGKILGLDEPITRRDFLDGTLVVGGGLLIGSCPFLDTHAAVAPSDAGWTGYGGEGDYNASAGNTEEVVENAHATSRSC